MYVCPEGATTNGEGIISFKRGAFASLRAVRPIVFKYWTLGNVKATQDVAGFLYHTLISTGSIITTMSLQTLPNFEPNDYFWKNHWQEGKEEKWEAFARVTRQIMAEVGGFKLSDLHMQDKLIFKKALGELRKKKTA